MPPASSRPTPNLRRRPRPSVEGGTPFDKDVWELYDTRTDFGHATDVAAKNPEKLKELQALFDREARKNNVYPLADSLQALLTADRPKLVSGNKASYGPGTFRLPEDGVINIKNRSFSLVAEVENPGGNAEGVLVTLGGETGGYALLVQKGKRTFYYNFLGLERYAVTAAEPLPKDKWSIRFDFAYDGGGMGKGRHRHAVGQRQEGGRGPDCEDGAGHLLDGRHVRRG
jgi:hypothetical protein